MDADKTRYRSDTKCHFSRNKALESIALRNKITKNINGIKEDIALLKDVLEKIIGICQADDYTSCLESDLFDSPQSLQGVYTGDLRWI
nr:201_t:CDS:2 [Entrophospora candida]